MIGDSLEADIFGAKNLGMKTIWITRRAQYTEDEHSNASTPTLA